MSCFKIIFLICVLSCTGLLASPFGGSVCPSRSQFNACGTACPKTCSNKDVLVYCTDKCRPGCFCEPGYVENNNGECVLPEKCPETKTCPTHSQYNECGTFCPKTCKNKDMLIKCVSKCKAGCFCEPGYLENDNGECVLIEDCPKTKICPANSQYNECGTPCPKTCKNKDILISCIAKCQKGCFCEPGYVEDDNGDCVLIEDCPKTCPPNSQYNKCGPACPRTCRDKGPNTSCTGGCLPGCYCEPGFVLDDKGFCVSEHNCHILQYPIDVRNDKKLID